MYRPQCPSDGVEIRNGHRQLLLDVWFVVTAELGRKREKSRKLPVGMLSQFRHFGRKHEAGTYSSRAEGVCSEPHLSLMTLMCGPTPSLQRPPPLALMDVGISLAALLNKDSPGAQPAPV